MLLVLRIVDVTITVDVDGIELAGALTDPLDDEAGLACEDDGTDAGTTTELEPAALEDIDAEAELTGIELVPP